MGIYTYTHLFHVFFNLRGSRRCQCWCCGETNVLGHTGHDRYLLVVGSLVRDLLRAARRERNGMVGANVFALEAIVLDGIKLLADGTRMLLAGVSDSLEKGTVNLGSFGHTLVHQCLHPVSIEGLLIVKLGVAMSLDTLKLSQVLRVGWIWPAEHIQFAIELGYPFVIDSVIRSQHEYTKRSNLAGLLVT